MYDVLIIGGGGAGLSSALEAKKAGAKVAIVSENYPTRSQTSMAQGGINAALANVESDSVQDHISDTIKASKGLADPKMVEVLCSEAIESIEWLNSIGVPFSRLDDGKIAQRKLGGASAKRACYSQDYTGLKILHTLYDQILKEKITQINRHHLLDLIVQDNTIGGAVFLDLIDMKVVEIRAKSVVLATGGYAGLYKNHTTNMPQSTGDGIVSAYKAGAKISNLEFVQFHPTALKGSGVLISESARGAGGKLINSKNERFVDELKPRDEVARAIKEQLDMGEEIFLDIRHLGEEFINESIPQERKLSIIYAGVDPVEKPMPIIPAAHYSMGGVLVDESMQSSIVGLYCVGECSQARVHGANRLGGNSLLEIVAFGRIAGRSAAKFEGKDIQNTKTKENAIKMIDSIYENEPTRNFYEAKNRLSKRLYEDVGIIKDEARLKEALKEFEEIENEMPDMGIVDKSRVYNTNLTQFLKFKNSLLLSKLICQLALQREESRGSHIRSDFPDQDEKFAKDSIIQKDEI